MITRQLSSTAKILQRWMESGYPYHVILFCLAGYKFLDIAEDVMEKGKITLYDTLIVNLLNTSATPGTTGLMKFITGLGAGGPYYLVFILIPTFLILKNHLREGLLLLLSLGGGFFLMSTMKELFGRARPVVGTPIITETGFSFPSGHSTVSACFYGFLIYLIFTSNQPVGIKVVLCALLGSLILLIGLSRVNLGVHYPSDVLAGFSLGAAWVSCCSLLCRYLSDRSVQKKIAIAPKTSL
jgi:membrane-associated phospholipid phosphatase